MLAAGVSRAAVIQEWPLAGLWPAQVWLHIYIRKLLETRKHSSLQEVCNGVVAVQLNVQC